MPFVQRVVEPKFLSRAVLHDAEGRPRIKDGELEAVTNHTLSSALKQLASVVLIANDIFQELNKQLEAVSVRTGKLRHRIGRVEQLVEAYDPKAVTVPEGDLTVFSSQCRHYETAQQLTKELFTAESRSGAVRRMYEAAAPVPVPVVRQGTGSHFCVTPVLGAAHRKLRVIDIETRLPARVSGMRRWTSLEAIGDVTSDLNCTRRVAVTDTVDHRLPSPEEQLQALALKFPSEMVEVDVSGRSFSRMSHLRRSMVVQGEIDDSTRRRRSRRIRSKRRNTIAGTDTKELAAIVGESSEGPLCTTTPEPDNILGEKKSHLESLKEWGLRLLRGEVTEPAVRLRESVRAARRRLDKEEPTPHSSSGNWSASSESGSTATSHHPRSSVSSGSVCQKHGRRSSPHGRMVSTSSSVTSESTLTPDDGETCSTYSCDTEGYYTSFHLDSGLKTLREEEPMPALHTMSALSASRGNTLTADSEYELFGKGSTSTTASSAGTVCTTLLLPLAPSVPERVNSQLSSSLPERGVKALHSLGNKDPNLSIKETSSLKIESKKNPIRVDMKKLQTELNNKSNLTKENVSRIKDSMKMNVKKYEQKSNLTRENVEKLKVAEEKKGIITVEVHHNQEGPEKCGDSPDSGHNTCSSPVDSITSPSIDLEMSECSDLEGVDRVERIREKTTINSSRIPSMCVITPPVSEDEEVSLRGPVDAGDYVRIADVSPAAVSPVLTRETEYVSLNELPPNDSLERKRRQGARVTLDSEGKVVYSSESLRRRKAIHTTQTFEPGPNVATVSSPVMPRVANIRPVVSNGSPSLGGRSHSPSPTRVITPTSTLIKSQTQNGSTKQQSEVDSSRKPLSPVTSNRPLSPLVSSTERTAFTRSKSQQYFPKSSYGRTMSPISPLVSTNQRESRPMSPSVFAERSLSPKMVVRARQAANAVSPTPQRGAYVKMQDSEEDDLKNVIKRSDSYRMANDETKPVNSNTLTRTKCGVVAGPSLLSAIQTARPNKDDALSEQSPSTPVKQRIPPTNPNLTSSTPTRHDNANLDFSTNLSPIQPRATTPTSRPAMDLYAIIHESKKKIMQLRERNNSPTLTERITSRLQLAPSEATTSKSSPSTPVRMLNTKANIPINENILRMNSNARCSTPDRSPAPNTPERYLQEKMTGSGCSTPERMYAARTAPGSGCSTPERIYATRTAPGSGCSTPERNIRVIPPEGPTWPKAIPASQVPNLRMSPSPSYDYLNLSPSGHYVKAQSPSPRMDPSQFPSYPDYRSLPRMGRESPRRHPVNSLPASPARNVFAPRETSTLDRHSPSLASDRHGKPQATSRNDFKQLLLRTNFSNPPSSTSAVERLKNKQQPSPVKTNKSWKSNILSSTIPEDCAEDDESSDRKYTYAQGLPRSSALVSQQCRAFDMSKSPTNVNRNSPTDKLRTSPTLETAL